MCHSTFMDCLRSVLCIQVSKCGVQFFNQLAYSSLIAFTPSQTLVMAEMCTCSPKTQPLILKPVGIKDQEPIT